MLDATDAMQATYHEVVRTSEGRLGSRLTTFEYEVFTMLFEGQARTPEQMLRLFGGSTSTFYASLASLTAKDAIRGLQNPHDTRSKLYCLSDKALGVLKTQWQAYADADTDYLEKLNSPGQRFKSLGVYIKQKLNIKPYTCEFQILLFLFYNPGLTNKQLLKLVDVSPAKHNLSIAELKRNGMLKICKDPSDGRRKLYCLTYSAKADIKDFYNGLLNWTARKVASLSGQDAV